MRRFASGSVCFVNEAKEPPGQVLLFFDSDINDRTTDFACEH
jgi:hypothetical protein